MKKIIVRQHADTAAHQLPEDLHPVLQRIYLARNISSATQLDQGLARLLPPDALQGMPEAVDLLATAVQEGQRILIIGDFDADGATSSALMVSALRRMGAQQVDFLVPNRFEFGYGLTPEIVAVAARSSPDLIVTVDNGISSIDGVAAAHRQGIRVLVTDHHLPGRELPAADAIVNPNQPGDSFPSKNLAGVGVAFYLLMALRGRLRDSGWFTRQNIAEPNLADYLDLVALGTVADLVPLDDNNRVLVQQGLQRIRAGRCRPGIQALLNIAGRNSVRVVASDFGFAVGPRLNAAGRIDDMALGIECLLSEDPAQARQLAERLDALNRERREIEADMKQQALAYVEEIQYGEDELPPGFCLFDPDWHQGVIGILAARIKERYHRPVIAFARSGPNAIKGSARSIPGLHIRDTLDAVAAQHPDILQKFGGHAMAAGLSLDEDQLPAFETAFLQELTQRLDPDLLTGVVESDGRLDSTDFSLELSELLRSSGPWGQGFPEPVFDGDFTVVNQRIVGEHHLKLSVRPEGGTQVLDAIAFNQAADHSLRNGQQVHLAYRLDSNEYRGMLGLQLMVEVIEVIDR
ncbi:MAG TPA: single-stranded-DNA-specific exonuclease RecJ [Gammaproteobacteria bacterium]|nr:single-stranded-DNA-specific exonuclease RecJ [Gammaproteobacteria bacterium]